MKRFVLIDGNAILHRAYHALPPLTNKDGVVVNAVYGFYSMLLKVIQDLKPSFLAVAFDRAAPTFRQQLYVAYQAQRPKMADDLTPQVDLVHQVLAKMNVAVFEIDGYEADDIIGTIAKLVVQKTRNTQKVRRSDKSDTQKVRRPGSSEFSEYSENIEVIIVSGDRDMLQLVNFHVKVYAPIIGLTKTVIFDEKAVEEKYGVKPSQIIDYKSLIGDPSDNYPGVSGVGPKTASELLKKYGSFENLYQKLGELPPKISQSLATDAEQASLAKKLATIATDAPIPFDIEKCSFKRFDIAGAKKAFEDLGFKSLFKRLPGYEEESSGQEEKSSIKKKQKVQQMGLI